jgi:leucyl/phenylalanyl-tRNA--protein transferase
LVRYTSDIAKTTLTPELLLRAYAAGIFPMSTGRDADSIVWLSPEERGIVPLQDFHVPHRLARTVRSDRFRVCVDTAFGEVIRNCASPAPHREETWINREIENLYTELHAKGHAHSVECWRGDQLVGGLYGVKLGAAFFGESMFSLARDASKVALVHLVARLIRGGFALLDAQFTTAHLEQFGAIEIPRDEYLRLLSDATAATADFYCPEPSGKSGTFSLARASGDTGLTGVMEATVGGCWPGWFVLQLITHTS